jgi:Ca2+/Na+ antiporter
VGHAHEEEDEEEESVVKGALYLLAGGILIVLFSSPFINSVVEVATLWRVSPTLLAFFLAPIASEAPEILESISLSRKGNLQNINIAFSNLIGGTITKTTLLCGVS